MNREQVIKFAKQVGLPHWYETEGVVNEELLVKFAKLVAEHEREACAIVCDDINAKYKSPQDTAERVASQWCADAIRARGSVATNDTSQERVDETAKQRHEQLTDDEILEMWGLHDVHLGIVDFVRAIEAKLKEKNT